MKTDCPRLIEVALPVREISAEAVRQKSPQRGHLSTLHLWWARRPLAACLAIVFASVVPDPDHPSCPTEFRTAVERHLKTHVPHALKHYKRGRRTIADVDPYKPYEGMPDTLRNRLLTFIAKWSPEAVTFENGKSTKEPAPKELLDDRSLVKWETSDPKNPQGRAVLDIARELVRVANGGKPPTVLDPFSGGGAIPLEAGRLGCQPIANDYNPVAYLILKGSCEYPQRYGMPNPRPSAEPESDLRMSHEDEVPLARDVEKWVRWVLNRATERIGHLYPAGKDGRRVVGYFWARTVPCSNPSCRGEIPLLRTLLLCKNKKGRRVALTLNVDKQAKSVGFGLAKDGAIRRTEGTVQDRGNALCLYCEQVTPVADVRRAGVAGRIGERMVAVIVEGNQGGKDYRPLEDGDLKAFEEAVAIDVKRPSEPILPEVTAGAAETVTNSSGIRVHLYGMRTWGSLFNHRQLVAMQAFTECLREALDAMKEEVTDEEYRKVLATYLGLWLSRNSMRMSTVGAWHVSEEKVEKPFEGARLSMKVDYPEANPFSDVSGGFANQLDWILRFLEREAPSGSVAATVLRGDGAALAIPTGTVDAVVTDPPYFDEAAYADLSDFFYVWLKRAIGDMVPEALSTPQAPKSDEATALRHRHGGDAEAADRHFTDKLGLVFAEGKRVTKADGLFSIIFAHQETEAWTALIRSLFSAGLTIDATWPIEMEMKNRPRAQNSAALQTSITVVCRTRVIGSAASFKTVRGEIEAAVADSVRRFWTYGFRGADLIVACYGPAVGVFGKYERVEKADGTPVGIPDLLDLARRAAMDAIAGDFRGDGVSTLYYVWANIYGAGDQPWDDARLVVQVGGTGEDAMTVASRAGIFVVDGSTCRLALLTDRADRRGLGQDPNGPLIDALHRAMQLWKEEKRPELVSFLRDRGFLDNGAPFWKLAQALFEVLPRDAEDWKLVSALLTERPTLRAEGQRAAPEKRTDRALTEFTDKEA